MSARVAWGRPHSRLRGSDRRTARASSLLLEALPAIEHEHPGLRLLVVGGGDLDAARRRVPAGLGERVLFLGPVPDVDKASALRTADLYSAPNTGGESFGIVLIEAMSAGTPVLASDIPAFRRCSATRPTAPASATRTSPT